MYICAAPYACARERLENVFGTAQAFKAAGRLTPVIVLGSRYDKLKWWKSQAASDDKTTSVSNRPGTETTALRIAQQALAGKTVPKHLQVPLLDVERDEDMDAAPAQVQPDGVSGILHTACETRQMIDKKQAMKNRCDGGRSGPGRIGPSSYPPLFRRVGSSREFLAFRWCRAVSRRLR